MEITENDVKRIQQKLQQVLLQAAVQKKENEKLQVKLQKLTASLHESEQQIAQMQQQIQLLKLATVQMNDEDKVALTKQLNKFIKEIDKCVAMMGE
jgi:uncharacterized caspase-like protein